MTDYISRHGARLALAKMRSDYDLDYNAIIDKCINRISQLPIYRQEQKVGKWRPYPILDGCVQCSVCGVLSMCESNYCSTCGAKMEGAEE